MTDELNINNGQKGVLYLCATPIGNLEDITLRAIRILGEVDAILCEDTRRTVKLLNHLEIKKPLISYHEHNKQTRDIEIIEKIRSGSSYALVSDAGMPCISDPGASIVKLAAENGITVTVIPGACAAVSALAVSGLDTEGFIFEGFLPEKGADRRNRLSKIAEYINTSIIYESPHNLLKTLKDILESAGDRKIALARELTKLHEEILRLKVSEAIEVYTQTEPRGEFVIVMEAASVIKKEALTQIEILSQVKKEMDNGLSKKEAIKKAAKDFALKKSDVYSLVEENK